MLDIFLFFLIIHDYRIYIEPEASPIQFLRYEKVISIVTF